MSDVDVIGEAGRDYLRHLRIGTTNETLLHALDDVILELCPELLDEEDEQR